MSEPEPKFNCTVCSACCMFIHKNWVGYEQFKEDGWITPSGACMNLDLATRRCTIYENRPAVCDVKKEYQMLRPPITLQQWYDYVETCCDQSHLREYGVPRERGEECSHKKAPSK